MSNFANNYQSNIHAIGLTAAWSVLLNFSIICGALRYDKVAAIAHAVFGFIIFILTFICILYLMIPYGFNISLSVDGNLLYAHAVMGCALLGFIVIQVAGGLMARLFQQNKKMDIFKLKSLRAAHRYFGYFMTLAYKADVLYMFYVNTYVFISLLVWECLCIIAWIIIKLFFYKLQTKIVDSQTKEYLCPQIESLEEVAKITNHYIIFANYVYDSKELEETHPGGYKVIRYMKGREVDRFLYGMYSAELYPELPPYSHSAFSLQLIGRPIAKLVTPPTYQGLRGEIIEAQIRYKSIVSQKTQIYSIGIAPKYDRIRFLGYRDVRQLGQYYSFTLIQKITRLYTSVNFLNSRNISLMNAILQLNQDSSMKKMSQKKTKVQTQLSKMLENNKQSDVKQRLSDDNEEDISDSYIPIMLKVYNTGKLTKALKSVDFLNTSVQISIPRGRGLELQTTKPGRIIIVAGGTGLFPFSDLIDLLFKAQLIAKGHQMSSQLLRNDPLLNQEPFEKYFFVFLIAINQPEDIHPITFAQLVRLSEHERRVKVVMRVSKNAQKIQGICGNIQLTRQYFNKRVLSESAIADFSRVWICGPPKLNTDTANILLQNGYTSDQFLLV